MPVAEDGIERDVKVTTWGSPLSHAVVSLFYFGGTPSSAEEPPLHSLAMSKNDIYKERAIHLVCIDKPGVGGSQLDTAFSIRCDWPRIVSNVADELGIGEEYGVFGISNGGPHVMACLSTQDTRYKKRVRAAAMIVGASDVSASGYFSISHPSGMFEVRLCFPSGAFTDNLPQGVFNSLPLFITGPLIFAALKVASGDFL